ncbi:MerR family transcriptional regulator [Thermomonospora umbrina]|uniref:DNA-binding transcriptional MerR regulator n=1 Tax=Thermomonospora umbrina TaxID=111806 RepID=A0A3D9SHX1_9ACTN|nr:MerR family transcriptional regulator [Thermomonospora umbrina]REE95509.1 DNA-binding transcriptional MerR regulator [Thermomonospora umbrina]
MGDGAEFFTIGRLAERTGLTARTIRFWSDAGVVPPAGRSANGYRIYDAAAVARLDLVRTLRDLGFGLEEVRAVLARTTGLAEVARVHVAALDAEIRTLRLRRSVLSAVARHGKTIEETMVTHRLAGLTATERRRLIDDFVNGVFEGIDPEAPAMGIATGMRAVELPDDPTPEQVDAWLELAELVHDEGFRRRVREMAVAGENGGPGTGHAVDPGLVAEHTGRALAEGIAPDSPEGGRVLDLIVAPDTPAERRAEILQGLETFTDARVERYWRLVGIINAYPPFPSAVPGFEWLIAALGAHPRA